MLLCPNRIIDLFIGSQVDCDALKGNQQVLYHLYTSHNIYPNSAKNKKNQTNKQKKLGNISLYNVTVLNSSLYPSIQEFKIAFCLKMCIVKWFMFFQVEKSGHNFCFTYPALATVDSQWGSFPLRGPQRLWNKLEFCSLSGTNRRYLWICKSTHTSANIVMYKSTAINIWYKKKVRGLEV